ncbi:MAG TPA: YggS family pyridoxal phosphate-dependent enzyme [Lentisphaeria bacterium]|nr:YggS family pyridoxal phosphate-dependent enzyme [Lentisphaeria bacterium]
MNAIQDNLKAVSERIETALARAGRAPGTARLLAVSKTFAPAVIQEAYDAGQRSFGENRVQELVAKAPALPSDCEWHLIGHLQRNKVRQALGFATWIHSVDSPALLERIQRLADEVGAAPKLLLEVNVSGEESKIGFAPDAVEAALAEMPAGPAECVGLMTMAPLGADEGTLHSIFGGLRQLRDRLQDRLGMPLPELSMGMSSDLEAAIAEGATIVRVGTAIFGQR